MRRLRTFGVHVKNIGDEIFNVDELPGVSISVGETIDLTDAALVNYYRDPTSAKRALENLPGTSLYSGLHADPPILEVHYIPKIVEELGE